MSSLVAGAAIAHSPLLNVPPRADEVAALDAYKRCLAALGTQIQAFAPDVLVVVGQDHFRTLFYDLMPAMLIGVGKLQGWGDWGTWSGDLETDTALAAHLHTGLLNEGFDLACSYDLKVDHGITQPVELLGLPRTLPIIPILLNTSAPPLPSPQRCYQLGAAITRVLRGFDAPRRVALIASGGMSHSPPAVSVRSTNPADQEAVHRLIHGRELVAQNKEGRQQRLMAAVQAGRFAGSVRPAWDRAVLDAFTAGQVASLAQTMTEDSIEAEGGCGGQEIRTWLTLAGAYEGARAREVCYFPIESLITGMGCVAYGT